MYLVRYPPFSHLMNPADLGAEQYSYRGDDLYCEDVAIAELADRFGTPLYVYSRASMASRFELLRDAFGPDAHICYAVKSNSNLSLLRLFAQLGAVSDFGMAYINSAPLVFI